MSQIENDVAAIARIDAVPTILDVVCRTTGMGFVAVARVTEDRWVACAVRDEINFGLQPGGELRVETTICNEIRGSGELVVIDCVEADPAYRRHPVPAMYGFESYISVPIRRTDGSFFGTLCAIDRQPAKLNTVEIIGMFRLFADLIGLHLDAQERLATSEAALLDAQQTAELREQFIAVLGHDLRSPLAAIDAGARVLGRRELDDSGRAVLQAIHRSIRRMAKLIDDALDLARGRLGGGLPLQPAAVSLAALCEEVIAELRAAFPDRTIEGEIELPGPIRCDPARMAQLVSNLLSNALTHGTPDGPVRVSAIVDGGWLALSVANAGAPIPADTIGRLFHPFFRGGAAPGSQGLGLGLYISAEIARAHGGTLDVTSTIEETRFTFRMPLT